MRVAAGDDFFAAGFGRAGAAAFFTAGDFAIFAGADFRAEAWRALPVFFVFAEVPFARFAAMDFTDLPDLPVLPVLPVWPVLPVLAGPADLPDFPALPLRAARAVLRAAGFRAVFFADFLLLPFFLLPVWLAAVFFFFFATSSSSCQSPGRLSPGRRSPGRRRGPRRDHTIPEMANRDGDRVRITPRPSGISIEIRPLVERKKDRVRLSLAAAVLVLAAFLGGARLASAWDAGLRKGDFSDLPLPVLAILSLAVGISTPLALLGLAALAFAEETVEVDRDRIVIRTSAFEKVTIHTIPRDTLECWRSTYLPLSPWWTWAVERLAARAGGRLTPLAGMAGPAEKRRIGRALARATGKPLVRDFGREDHGEPPGSV